MYMPTIARFSGISIRMNPKGKEHNPPHVHVIYENHEISINIENHISRGFGFPNKQHIMALRFIMLFEKQLLDMWDTQVFCLIDYKGE